MKARWLLVLLATAAPLPSADGAPPEPPALAQRLDQGIDAALAQPRYAWRSDRAARQAMAETLPAQLLKGTLDAFGRWTDRFFKALGRGIKGFGRWLEGLLRKLPWSPRERAARPVPLPSQGEGDLWLGFGLFALVAVALGLFSYRRLRRRPAAQAVAVTAAPVLDLREPSLSGKELPEDGWLELAARLAAQGERRLALRAYYLAALAALGRGGWLRLAASRSVGDYRLQLERAGAAGALRRAFGDFSGLYERAWFGTLGVGDAELGDAARSQEALRALAL